jgi:hypothetical protein
MSPCIVLHFLDGRIIKGSTQEFSPEKQWCCFTEVETGKPMQVDYSTLKGIFFVKDFEGIPTYQERYHVGRNGYGTKVKVRFKDGETIIGYTPGLSPERMGFYLFPSDPHCNAQRIFVVRAATEEIVLLNKN